MAERNSPFVYILLFTAAVKKREASVYRAVSPCYNGICCL